MEETPRHQDDPMLRANTPSGDTLRAEQDAEREQTSHKDIEQEPSEHMENARPKSVGFWHASVDKTRMDVFKHYSFILGFLCAFILAVLSLYWGSLYHARENMSSLIVYVVNFETQSDAVVGPLLVRTSEDIVQNNTMPHLGYVTVPPSGFGNDPFNVRDAIYENQAWAALIVNPNATQMLRQAIELGNSSYDPTDACQLIYQDARDQETFDSFIQPQVSQLQKQFMTAVGTQWASLVLSNSSISREALQRVPQALNPAVGFSEINLRVFGPPQSTPSVSVGLIYLIILSFFAFSFFMPIHMKLVTSKEHPPVHFRSMVIWRWIAAVNAYFFLSLAYSLVSLAFQIPFSNSPAPSYEPAADPSPFGAATFVVYWMLNFIGMTALGMACENAALVVGFPWTSMWLIFWVITNVTTSFYPIELEPHFYYWGYAWPLHNIVEGSRTIIFGVHSRLGLNFGILFAWVGVGTALFPFCCWFQRWKMIRQKKKQS